jgi:16S rRNA (cytosine967-C5)-methyltransferase
MTPGARIQSAIELLDAIIAAAREGGAAADTIVARWFAARRYAGSKDRRAVRALVYDAIRLCGEVPASGRAAMLALAAERPDLRACFDGSPYAPAPIGADERAAAVGVAPAWLIERLAASELDHAEQAALIERAPLDLRVNSLRPGDVAIDGAGALDFLPGALRLPPDTPVDRLPAYAEGRIEVQDAGSQLVTLASGARPGDTVVDLCAGAGGKTLALAAMMQDRGRILACDVDRGRLQKLPARAERAGVSIAETRLMNPMREMEALADLAGAADLVLIDAPCSGTGTWRRNPEARWRLTPDRLSRLTATQGRLLDLGAALVRPGGRLCYVTCSLLGEEGAGAIAAFRARNPAWQTRTPAISIGAPRGDGIRLTPRSHSTDGFFVAMMGRP